MVDHLSDAISHQESLDRMERGVEAGRYDPIGIFRGDRLEEVAVVTPLINVALCRRQAWTPRLRRID